MTKNISILIFAMIFGFSQISLAQRTKTRTSVKTKRVKRAASRNAPIPFSKRSYFIFGPKVMLWQESMPATRSGVGEHMGSQFTGVSLGTTYRKPFSNIRWVQSHALDLSWGTLVAKSAGSTITDQLRNQMWYGVTLSPGFGYRTTSASEVALNIPLMYRVIDWQLKDAALDMGRDTSFSYGVMGSFVSQMSTQSSLQISFTEQIAWKALVWSIGWNYRFL